MIRGTGSRLHQANDSSKRVIKGKGARKVIPSFTYLQVIGNVHRRYVAVQYSK